jgi:hypothetical protein
MLVGPFKQVVMGGNVKLKSPIYHLTSLVMEQHTFKNLNNFLNTHLNTLQQSRGQSSNIYLNPVHFYQC